jgi:O-antigen/teichoic acid export membrane protein
VRRTGLFFALLAIASVISILKSAAMAAVLAPIDFAYYASAFAVVGIGSVFISFGLTEATVKKYTRLAAFHQFGAIQADLWSICRKLLVRYGVILILGLPISMISGGPNTMLAFSAVIVLCFATNCFAVVSSLFRGFDLLAGLGWSALARACVALLIVATVSYQFGWHVGIAAEALGTASLSVIFLFYLSRVTRRSARTQHEVPPPPEGKAGEFKVSDGIWLFAASVATLIPMSFDRWWIATFDTAGTAAQYAFVGIWLSGAYTASSIYVQKFGPDVVRSRALGELESPLRRTLLHAGILAGVLTLGTIVTFAAIYLLLYDTFWRKYDLTFGVVAIAALGVSAQVSPLFDWTLIALNGERHVLLGGAIFAVITVSLFALTTALGLGFSGYVGAFAIGRVCQALLQSLLIRGLARDAVVASRR